jgi:hypothetical protein
MSTELNRLLRPAINHVLKQLTEKGEVPVFAAALDARGSAMYLNPPPELRVSGPSATNVEALRKMLQATGTSGALLTARVAVVRDSGSPKLTAAQLHVDHINDPCAHTVTIPYELSEGGGVKIGQAFLRESNTRLL